MKKTLLSFLALAFCATLVQAQVTSVNAVGMIKLNVAPQKLTFVSLPFNVEGTTLDEVVGDQLTGAGNSGSSDRIIVFDADTFTYTAYWKVEGTGTSYDDKWYIDNGAFPPVAADATIVTGTGFWVESRSASAQNLIISGEVPSSVVEVSIPIGLKQIGLPYPVEVSVNDSDFDINQVANGAGNSGSSDRLILWDSVNQQYVPLWLVEGTGLSEYDGYWHYDDGQFPPVRATEVLSPGEGFWFERRGSSANWNPTKPYDWP